MGTLQQALAIRRKVKDKTGVAKTLSKLGLVYSIGIKQYSKGLELLQQALVIQEKVGDKFQAGITLTRIAAAYSQALAIAKQIKNPLLEANALQTLKSPNLNR